MRKRNDKETAEKSTPQVNNTNKINPKSLLHKEMIFKYAVVLPTYCLSHIISHRIVPDKTLCVSNSTGLRGSSNRTLKIFLVSLSITNNNNNANAVGKAVNAIIKVIHLLKEMTTRVK